MSDLAHPVAQAGERLFAQHCGVDAVNRAEQGEWPLALWQGIEALGAGQLLVPENRGGAGGDWHDACLLLERAGAVRGVRSRQ